MREKGFYHPQNGYWQAIGGADVSRYPAGTIEVPLKPSAQHQWDGSAWVPIPPDPAKQAAAEAKAARINASKAKISQALGLTVDEIKEALGLK